jgi:chromosome segregation ATPase
MATSFMRPKPTTPQPTISDLVQRIDALNGQFDALKQQLNQINTAQTKLNTAQTKLDAAQGQSTKSAKQLKIAALQQLMVQKHNLPPESLLSTRPPSKRKRLLQLQSRILEPNPSPEQQCL